ncbi:succinate--CoA ligase subunit alpha [candidate division WOR-3 bacterium]|uniref:Succinate--CoA ligase [ADP-forming] subunit alpha n=1 Tax=candidate division WOR-3 bacterium TaxID=2052148 RepID=A0A9D5QDP5_UNCW3|nr:succinate--CoA ligase subunit alpha [candidate division WOR-3 bacterium]MBD3364260.1 succinate--CoA ligase subunit alpha [candidate division WOR-3 bacterium]
MSVFVDKDTRVLVQGITGRDGLFHALSMKEYGTEVAGGVTPGKGGQKVEGFPVFDSMEEAVRKTGANTSVIFVPERFASDAIVEAADAGVGLVVCITEGLPVKDMLQVVSYLERKGTKLIGPNCPGVISPGKSKVGILPGHIFREGNVGVVSRSGTLTYELVSHVTNAGLGQSTCVGIGGDPIIGSNFLDVLKMFAEDAETEAVVLVGEIGGSDEEEAARFIKDELGKPAVAFIAGRTAPKGKRMGHAGAIISGSSGTAEDKVAALSAAGIPVAAEPAEIAGLLKEKV